MTSPLKVERRFSGATLEYREESSERPLIRGYAALFNVRSQNLGTRARPWYETIAPGSFDGVLRDDVALLINHDSSLILGRTRSGTLRIGVDASGLFYACDPVDNSIGRDFTESIRRRDIYQSSFQFVIAQGGERWTEESGVPIRTITKIERLYDVSCVTYPATLETSAQISGMPGAFGRGAALDDAAAIAAAHRARELQLLASECEAGCAPEGSTSDLAIAAASRARELALAELS